MKFIDKLERKFGKYAIHNLIWYILGCYALGLVISIFAPSIYNDYLALDIGMVLKGQVWRLITFIIAPQPVSLIFQVFFFMMYYLIGTELEYLWGTFRFNLYFFVGILFHIIAAVICYVLWGISFNVGIYYLNMAMFLAYVSEFPDAMFILFVIPVKGKWLGYLDIAYLAVTIFAGFCWFFAPGLALRFLSYGIMAYPSIAMAAIASLANFYLFQYLFKRRVRRSPIQFKQKISYERKKASAAKENGGARHKCAVCGRTELDGDNLEFRYCSKCEGNYEYCQDHLYTHKHITKG